LFILREGWLAEELAKRDDVKCVGRGRGGREGATLSAKGARIITASLSPTPPPIPNSMEFPTWGMVRKQVRKQVFFKILDDVAKETS